ncbi:MAG: ATP-binding protein [Desulfobacterales bacterium]|nr:ATP-binding protein [Desulfobacterales bacterium]
MPKQTDYTYKKLNHAVGRAIHQYDMIADGDRIALGLSGGADSLTLIYILKERLPRIPVNYEIFAFHIDPGFENGFSVPLQDYCRRNGYRLEVVNTNIGSIAHGEENRENPCFLCARLRRKRLFELAAANGCGKLALGHNKDDLIETLFLNICYAGEISTMLPAQPFFDGEITVIRPLAFADEKDIRRFAKDNGFPEFINPCPSAGQSSRREMRLLLNQLYQQNRKIKGNIFRAMSHVKPDYLLR